MNWWLLTNVRMMKMMHLLSLWVVLLTHSCCVSSETKFLTVSVGGSVMLPCELDQDTPPPSALRLVRSWLRPGQFLFKYSRTEASVDHDDDRGRVAVSGDPSSGSVNVTLSQLKLSDTDRYSCQFVVMNLSSEDDVVFGRDDFLLLTSSNAAAMEDVEWLDVCSGASAAIPCVGPHGAVEGLTLKRQRGKNPVEFLFHSQQESFSEEGFPAARVHLSSAPGPRGLTYNLTVLQMQPQDSGRYSCQFVQPGASDNMAALGRKVVFVSVQDGVCSCSVFYTLLSIMCSAVVALVLLLGFLFIRHVRGRRGQQPHPQSAIYEEMTGVKLSKPHARHLEEVESRDFPVKSPAPQNHYETPGLQLK